MMRQSFYTLRGYDQLDRKSVSAAMEDYLEMIYRQWLTGRFLRIGELASQLHVQPPAASKMVQRLGEAGYVVLPLDGCIELTELGCDMGQYLFMRHDVLNRFFCLINQSQQEVELVEKIEHFMDRRTVLNIAQLLCETATEE